MLSTPVRQPVTTTAKERSPNYRDHTARRALRVVRALGRMLLIDRASRVRSILAIIILLSLVDLDMTLVYAKYTGMVEQNPIARELMSRGAVWSLVGWKFATVAIAVGLLYKVRKHRSGELGAWLCLGVLCWLTARWMHYNDEISVLQAAAVSPMVQSDPKYVMIPEAD